MASDRTGRVSKNLDFANQAPPSSVSYDDTQVEFFSRLGVDYKPATPSELPGLLARFDSIAGAPADEVAGRDLAASPERRKLVIDAVRAEANLAGVERLAGQESEERLQRLIERHEPAVRLFGDSREAAVAAARNVAAVRDRPIFGLDVFEGDGFRQARLKRWEWLLGIARRAIQNARSGALADERFAETRELMRAPGEMTEFSDREDMLRAIYQLDERERSLVRRRAEAGRDDDDPWSDADRACLTRARKRAERAREEVRSRRVT